MPPYTAGKLLHPVYYLLSRASEDIYIVPIYPVRLAYAHNAAYTVMQGDREGTPDVGPNPPNIPTSKSPDTDAHTHCPDVSNGGGLGDEPQTQLRTAHATAIHPREALGGRGAHGAGHGPHSV